MIGTRKLSLGSGCIDQNTYFSGPALEDPSLGHNFSADVCDIRCNVINSSHTLAKLLESRLFYLKLCLEPHACRMTVTYIQESDFVIYVKNSYYFKLLCTLSHSCSSNQRQFFTNSFPQNYSIRTRHLISY